MTVWIVGESRDELNAWDFVGAFSTESLAVSACTTERYFVGPTEMDFRTPDGAHDWPSAYFPIKEPQ